MIRIATLTAHVFHSPKSPNFLQFSKRFGFLDRGEDIGGVHEGLDQRLLYGTHVGLYPNLHPYTFAFVNFIAGATTGKVDYSVDFTIKRIEERKNKEKSLEDGPKDFLTKYLEGRANDPVKFTDYDVVMGAFGNIIAGADTTWITLNAILYYLLKNPQCLQKLQQEIDEKTAKGELSDPVPWKEAKYMPYLQAVIKEGQRIFPATGLPIFRYVPDGGATICGKYFPAGVSTVRPILTSPGESPPLTIGGYVDRSRRQQLGSPPQHQSLRPRPRRLPS